MTDQPASYSRTTGRAIATELHRLADTAPSHAMEAYDELEEAYHDGLREMASRLRARAVELGS